MMKQEFEELAGYEVSDEAYYNVIEPMYLATNLEKQEFVKCINKKQFALKTKKQLINEAKKIARQFTTNKITSLDEEFKLEDELEEIRKEIKSRWYPGMSVYINWEHEVYAHICITYPKSIEIYNKFSGGSVYYNLI